MCRVTWLPTTYVLYVQHINVMRMWWEQPTRIVYDPAHNKVFCVYKLEDNSPSRRVTM